MPSAPYRRTLDPFTLGVNDKVIVRIIDDANIPNDPENADWQAYQAWLAEGNAPDDALPFED